LLRWPCNVLKVKQCNTTFVRYSDVAILLAWEPNTKTIETHCVGLKLGLKLVTGSFRPKLIGVDG